MTKQYPDSWWNSAWLNHPDVKVEFEMTLGNDVITPGTIIKFKNRVGKFKFRCLARNEVSGKAWIECIDMKYGTFRSFYADTLKGVDKPVRRRKAK